jgi:glycosyltransferase involved in cell wall biosynthesis
MRIVAFVNGNSGPSYHRIIMPLMLMKDVDVFITNNLLTEHFEKGCDIFMYNRILPEHCAAQIAELKKKYGFKTCVDVDDYWHLDEHHILYETYQQQEFAKSQIKHLGEADVVLTTNSRLASEIYLINKNVHVCPNAIPKQGQFDIETEPHYLTRLFWQGSITHRKDIEVIERPIDKLNKIATKIKMVMAGYTDGEPEWHSMALSYTAGLKHQYQLLPGVHVNDYYENYKHADICLIPLVKSRFNGFKSNLKVLEAANLGLPVIASQVDPYLDMPLLYCKSGNDWVKHITRLVESRKRRKEAGSKLKEFCEKHYNFHKINNERKQVLEYEAKKATESIK